MEITPGLAQSLLIKQQRAQLDRIGAAVGSPVIYLKGAWADPVLYGGRGERFGSDIDLLVAADRFTAFAEALRADGFTPRVRADRPVSAAVARAWSFASPDDRVDIDLHRELADPAWFELRAAACIDRARPYPSPDGPILSLAPVDQALFAAAHAASHGFAQGEKLIEDLARLDERWAIDWTTVAQEVGPAGLDAAMLWVARHLARRGARLPTAVTSPGKSAELRLRAAERIGRGSVGLAAIDRGRARAAMWLASGRGGALLRYGARWARLRVADWREG